jgi:hypothetical protein
MALNSMYQSMDVNDLLMQCTTEIKAHNNKRRRNSDEGSCVEDGDGKPVKLYLTNKQFGKFNRAGIPSSHFKDGFDTREEIDCAFAGADEARYAFQKANGGQDPCQGD